MKETHRPEEKVKEAKLTSSDPFYVASNMKHSKSDRPFSLLPRELRQKTTVTIISDERFSGGTSAIPSLNLKVQ
jgi:hypothetical protein